MALLDTAGVSIRHLLLTCINSGGSMISQKSTSTSGFAKSFEKPHETEKRFRGWIGAPTSYFAKISAKPHETEKRGWIGG